MDQVKEVQDTEIFCIRGVDFGYSGKSLLFKGLNIVVREGQFILIGGPSGSGKTSFFRLLNRLQEPDKGEVLYRGKPLLAYDPVILRQQVMYVPQIPVMVGESVEENVLFPYRFRINRSKPLPTRDLIRERMNDFLLDGIDLNDVAHRLSVGEQQRIALIRSMFLEPRVYLLDEPVSALDEQARKRVESWLVEERARKGITVIMISHANHDFREIKPLCYRIEGGGLREGSP